MGCEAEYLSDVDEMETIIEADKNWSWVKAVRKVSLFYCVRQKGRVQRGHYATPSAYEKTLKTYIDYTTFQPIVNMALALQ